MALSGGSGSYYWALLGVLLLSVVDTGLNLMEVDPFWVTGVRGLIILVALLLEVQKTRIRVRSVAARSGASAEAGTKS